MKVLDLFSGIGAFSLGLERAGMRTVAFCEIEPFCRRVLAKHWPEVPCYDDIRSLTAARLASDGIHVDVVCGGFPCQDISVAGKGVGIKGERSGLWSEFARLIGEIRPRYAILENVAALLFRGLGDVLGDLASLGYDAEWHCIPASTVGAPHQRDRIWVVAHSQCKGWKRHFQIIPPSCVEEAAYSESSGCFAVARCALAGDFAVLRKRYGDSVVSHRRRVQALGNSLVPQIPELIGRAILAYEAA